MPSSPSRPPREDLYRASLEGMGTRATAGDTPTGMTVLTGHFAVFSSWTRISSAWEGDFLESIAPGAFARTVRENGPTGTNRIRVLAEHGQDPTIGNKPLGSVLTLHEDTRGAFYEVDLLDVEYVNALVPAIKAGLYGASFRFRVIREQYVERPAKTSWNPTGLPLRTVMEAEVREFGPVLWPAYADATAGLRSVTDEFVYGRLASDPERLARLRALDSVRKPKPKPIGARAPWHLS